MAIAVGNTQTNVSSAATSLAVTKPTGLANGDVLVTTCGTTALTAVVPTGFTQIGRSATSAGEEVTVAYKVVTNAAGEAASYTWTGTGGRTSVGITALTGVDTTTPLDVTAYTDASTTGSVDLFLTTVTDGALAYAAAVGDWSTDGMTVHSSMTTLFNLGNPGRRTAAAYETRPTAGGPIQRNFIHPTPTALPIAGIITAFRPQILTGGSASGTVTWSGTASGDNGFTGGSASGTVTWTGSATGTNDPGPSGLTATPMSDTQIDLSWTAASGAVGYDIERDGVVIVTNHTLTTYSDTGLTPSTTYTYRVRTVR